MLAISSLVVYLSSQQDNSLIGKMQYIDISVEQEIALGLEAAPEMDTRFGGLERDSDAQALVDEIGREIVRNSAAGRSPYRFEFHLLDDWETLNAFALPGNRCVCRSPARPLSLGGRSLAAGRAARGVRPGCPLEDTMPESRTVSCLGDLNPSAVLPERARSERSAQREKEKTL